MNLEGNKSTSSIYKQHKYIENEEGMIIKVPKKAETKMKGILLPIKSEATIAVYGQEIQYMNRYLIKPKYNIEIGDYFIFGNIDYEVISIEKWPKYQTLLLKVVK